jgi:hypothetical protein
MGDTADSKTILELERRILRALCREEGPADVRARASGHLTGYHWRGEEHRIVWEALGAASPPGGASATPLRERMASQTTRMGFPDVDWESYFGGDRQSDEELGALVRRLVEIRAQVG